MPTVFAYEEQVGLPARVGRVTRIKKEYPSDLQFEFELFDKISPIPADVLSEIAWDLDIGKWEMNRTHWAVKDVDLLAVLAEASLAEPEVTVSVDAVPGEPASPEHLIIIPNVFAVPISKPDPRLVALMMPFSVEFDPVAEAIHRACAKLDLHSERVDDLWEESTVIQEVFNLIYRSSVVVVDLTGRNANVMYETGIAHTLGRPVVPISADVGSLPFDLAHHRTLQYLPNEQGLEEMESKLERRLGSLNRSR